MQKMKDSDKPIQSQKEADEILEYLTKTTAEVLKLPMEEARKRCAALLKSSILDGLSPSSAEFQIAVDAFLSIPSSTYEHLK